jgi:hypothetical protein
MNLSPEVVGLIWGVIGTTAALFFAGFLRKGGEDLYAWLKAKIKPPPPNVPLPPPQPIIVHMTEGGKLTAPAQPPQRPTSVTFDEIKKAIDAAVPMQKQYIAKGFIGVRIQWDAYFRSGREREDGTVDVRVSLDRDNPAREVEFSVRLEDYSELSVLPADALVTVSGTIKVARSWGVELKDASMHIHPR